MNTRILIISLLALILLIGAKCEKPLIGRPTSGGGSTSIFQWGGGGSTSLKTPNFHTGTGAVEMKFTQGAPPDEIYEGDAFKVIVGLDNGGAHSIQEGSIYLINYDYDSMEIRGDESKSFKLDAKDQNNPAGGHEVLEFEMVNLNVPMLKEAKFAIEACYDYKTNAAIDICINPLQYKHIQIGPKGCNMGEVTSSGQGAPIAVTSVKPQILENGRNSYEMRLVIQVANKGSGLVRELNRKCGGEAIVNLDKIEFSEYSTEDDRIKCKTKDDKTDGKTLKLVEDEKENIITCVVQLSEIKNSYTTPLKIDLSYGYTDTMENGIKVKRFE